MPMTSLAVLLSRQPPGVRQPHLDPSCLSLSDSRNGSWAIDFRDERVLVFLGKRLNSGNRINEVVRQFSVPRLADQDEHPDSLAHDGVPLRKEDHGAYAARS